MGRVLKDHMDRADLAAKWIEHLDMIANEMEMSGYAHLSDHIDSITADLVHDIQCCISRGASVERR